MKQSDIVTIIVVALLGVLVSYFSLNAILSNPDEAEVSFKTVDAITTDLPEPSADVFNSAAINPTIEVYVGGCVDSNQNGTLDEEELLICNNNTVEIDDSDDSTSDSTSTADSDESDSATNSSTNSSSSTSSTNSTNSTNSNQSVESEGE